MATGIATLNFGSAPGKTDATVAVIGQASIVSGSLVEAWLRPEDLEEPGHSADEHMIEELRVDAATIVAGTGFTIYGHSTGKGRIYGEWSVAWAWV